MLGSSTIAGIVWLHPQWTPRSPSELAYYVVAWVVATLLSFLGSVFTTGLLILQPLQSMQARRNGAPFSIGDRVEVLAGRNAGRVGSVYDVWTERAQYRVELGTEEKDAVRDVFGGWQIRRSPQNDASS